jgi:hypothetical protein
VHAIPDAVREPGYAQEPDRPWPRCRYNDEGKSAQQLKKGLAGPPILQAVSDIDSRGDAQEDSKRRAAIPQADPADEGSVDSASDSTEKNVREKRHSSPLKTSNTGDKLRTSITLSARRLHPLVRRRGRSPTYCVM